MPSVTVTPQNSGTSSGPVGTVSIDSLPGTFLVQKADGSVNMSPIVQTLAGTVDAVSFANAVNVVIFTSTGPDAATLATPGAGDVGKLLILVNTNTTQNTVTTADNIVADGSGTNGNTITAPAHAGAVAMLVASDGAWNMVVGGTGSWVLSEV